MDDETRDALIELRVELLRVHARLDAMQEAILQTLALVGHLGGMNKDVRTHLQALEVFVGVPQA